MSRDVMRVLIVEDLPTDAELTERETRQVLPQSEFLRVETREDYLAAIGSFGPDIILSDYKLPRFDGMAALKLALERAPEIPFIIVTGSMNEDTAVECIKAGAWDYIIKEHIKRLGPAVLGALEKKRLRLEQKRTEAALKESEERFRLIFEYAPDAYYLNDLKGNFIDGNKAAEKLMGLEKAELVGKSFLKLRLLPLNQIPHAAALLAKNAMGRPTGPNEFVLKRKDGSKVSVEIRTHPAKINDTTVVLGIARDITERKQKEEQLKLAYADLKEAFDGSVLLMASTVEVRDPYTAGHQKKVAKIAEAIASEMKLSRERIRGIHMAGLIHDLGKIAVPAEILSKPGKLSDIEFNFIKTHSQVGYEILNPIHFPWPLAQIVLQHHERMNGSGYPSGISDGEIILEARIMAVADVVEAMSAHRPYRESRGIEKALEEIEEKKGKLYDPQVVDACLRLFREKGFQPDA